MAKKRSTRLETGRQFVINVGELTADVLKEMGVPE